MTHWLIERIASELLDLAQVVANTQESLKRATQQPQDKRFFLASAAFDMHGFYTGIEKLFQLIAKNIDQNTPSGSQWHRDLLDQMTSPVPYKRTTVITPETHAVLLEYLGFRHVVRNLYTFNLRSEDVIELIDKLEATFALVRQDLLAFSESLQRTN